MEQVPGVPNALAQLSLTCTSLVVTTAGLGKGRGERVLRFLSPPAGQGTPEVKARAARCLLRPTADVHRAGMERGSRWGDCATPGHASPQIKGYLPGAAPARGSQALLSCLTTPDSGLWAAGCWARGVFDGS